jgi:hypothetical protein
MEERDVPPGVELEPSPDQVLAALAEVWIRSDNADPGAVLPERICPYLRTTRAAQGRPPVRVGYETATSVAEAILRVARSLTLVMRSAFGCGALVDEVLRAFPRDAESDPWEFNLVLVWWRAPHVLKDIIAKGRSERSEFVRRLLAWDVGAALDAVRVEPLCRWLSELFRGIDWDLLRQDLELEFEAAAQPRHLAAGAEEVPSCTAEAARETGGGQTQVAITRDGKPPPPTSPNLFVRQPGNRYRIAFSGKEETVPMLAGLRVAQCLLKQPGKAAHVLVINRAIIERDLTAATVADALAGSEGEKGLSGFTADASLQPEPCSDEDLAKAEELVKGLEERAIEARMRGETGFDVANRLESEAERARQWIEEQRILAIRKRRGQPSQNSQVELVRSKLTKNFKNACQALRTKYNLPELIVDPENWTTV